MRYRESRAVPVPAVTLTSVAVAGSDAAKQRVAIETKGMVAKPNSALFVLTPLEAGALKRDSGTWTAGSLAIDRVVMRGGQRVEIYDGSQP